MSRFQPSRLTLLTALLVLAFALRIQDIAYRDYDLDEAWTYTNIIYARDAETFSQIYREPNNTLHILLTLPIANLIETKIGFRFANIAAGLLTIAVFARLAYRLLGREGMIIATLLAICAYGLVDYTQHMRPYIFAFLFALLSLLTFVERRKRWTSFWSAFVPLFHIGAMPILMAQDLLIFLKPRKWGYRSYLDFFIYRLPPYAMLGAMLYLVHLRRLAGKVISGGQSTPSLADIGQNSLVYFNGNHSQWGRGFVLLALGLILLFSLIKARTIWQTIRLKPLSWQVCGLWIFLSYSILYAMTILSNGPIRFFHLTHLAFAFALLLSASLLLLPKWIRWFCFLLLLGSQILGLGHFYRYPNRIYSETYQALEAWREGRTLYFEVIFPVQALALVIPEDEALDFLVYIPDGEAYPSSPYLYIAYADFEPPLPASCAVTAVWVYGAFHVHEC